MFKFLKNNKQYIVIDAGSHKIATIAFQILDNKPFINQIEHHKSKGFKNNQLNNINEFSSVIKLLLNKISNKTMKKEFFCNITDTNLLTKKKKKKNKTKKKRQKKKKKKIKKVLKKKN